MFRLRKLHKYAGVLSGIILILLSVTGFFLNHDNWKFLYASTIPNTYLPKTTIQHDKRLFNSYLVDIKENCEIAAGFRGIFVRREGEVYVKVLDIPVYQLITEQGIYWAATTEGIWQSNDNGMHWYLFALPDKVITSISVDKDKLLAVLEKKRLIFLDSAGNIIQKGQILIDKKDLFFDIPLSRFVRDVHYGRGLFDDGLSLLLNDFAAIWLTLLAVTGYLLWYYIRRIKIKKHYKNAIRFLLKLHASSWVMPAVLPLILLALTGILLDHSNFFASFMKRTIIPAHYLPPVYHTLKEDIWSVDYQNGVYRIGNRYGVYRSKDMRHWQMENKGFAYRMMHQNGRLYVSGMGAPNRIYEKGHWQILANTPHMFKSVNVVEGKAVFFSSHLESSDLPKLKSTALYTLLFSIHDGSFFASWWVFVNDIASILLLLLLFTGLKLWYKRYRQRFPSNKS